VPQARAAAAARAAVPPLRRAAALARLDKTVRPQTCAGMHHASACSDAFLRSNRRGSEQQPHLLLPDRYTNIAPEDCIEMLLPTVDEDHMLSAALSGGACLNDVPMYAQSPSLAAVPESFAFPAPAPAPAPPSVVAGWADGVARAAAATAAALRAAAARAAAPDEPMAAAGALPVRRGLPRAAPSQCQGVRGGGLLRAAATASASGSSSASDGGTSPARWPRPPLAPTPKQQSLQLMESVPEVVHRSTSADDIASMVAAIDTGAVGKGVRKRGRAATPRATASCVGVLSSSASLSLSSSQSASASESPPEARRADVEAMLGDAVANGFGAQAGPPAEQGQEQAHGRARPEAPQPNASVAWLRAALGLGPA
jgi:hypothetical protein